MNRRESLTLGSPTYVSPVRSRQPNYLPAFLMGDSTTYQSPRGKQPNQTKTLNTSFGRVLATPKNTPDKKKPKGPPVMTLEDSFHNFQTTRDTNDEEPLQTQNSGTPYFYETRANTAAMDDTRDEYDWTEHWVTIFGFAPNTVPFVLSEFGQLGTILKHQMTAEGNWIHLLFEDKIQVRRALARNGRIYDGCMMLGVIPCTDKKVMAMNKEEKRSNPLQRVNSMNFTLRNTPFKPLPIDENVKRSVPQKENSLMSKALDFVLGW